MELSVMFALWVTMGFGAGVLAHLKGHSFVLWFLYGFFLGGVALFHAIRVPRRRESEHGF